MQFGYGLWIKPDFSIYQKISKPIEKYIHLPFKTFNLMTRFLRAIATILLSDTKKAVFILEPTNRGYGDMGSFAQLYFSRAVLWDDFTHQWKELLLLMRGVSCMTCSTVLVWTTGGLLFPFGLFFLIIHNCFRFFGGHSNIFHSSNHHFIFLVVFNSFASNLEWPINKNDHL